MKADLEATPLMIQAAHAASLLLSYTNSSATAGGLPLDSSWQAVRSEIIPLLVDMGLGDRLKKIRAHPLFPLTQLAVLREESEGGAPSSLPPGLRSPTKGTSSSFVGSPSRRAPSAGYSAGGSSTLSQLLGAASPSRPSYYPTASALASSRVGSKSVEDIFLGGVAKMLRVDAQGVATSHGHTEDVSTVVVRTCKDINRFYGFPGTTPPPSNFVNYVNSQDLGVIRSIRAFKFVASGVPLFVPQPFLGMSPQFKDLLPKLGLTSAKYSILILPPHLQRVDMSMEGQVREPQLAAAVRNFHINHQRIYAQFKAYPPNGVAPVSYASGKYTFLSAPSLASAKEEEEQQEEEEGGGKEVERGGLLSSDDLADSLAAGDDLGLQAFGQGSLATTMAHAALVTSKGVVGVNSISQLSKRSRGSDFDDDVQFLEGSGSGGGGGNGGGSGAGSGSSGAGSGSSGGKSSTQVRSFVE